MPTWLRNMIAILVGFLVGSLVNMAIVGIGPKLIPLPDGVDLTDAEKIKESIQLLKPIHFLSPWLAHAMGTLVGAFVAAWIALNKKLVIAMIVAGLFLLGGITMVWMVGGPMWFILLDLLGAYVPMAYMGWFLADRWKTHHRLN
jgi:hypothetical protein